MRTSGVATELARLPEHWSEALAQRFFDRLSGAQRWLLLLDYDGTLAPFKQDRMQAVPYPGVLERVQALSSLKKGRVLLVSGRQVDDLRTLMPVQPAIEIWGSHGREHLSTDGEYRLIPLNRGEHDVVEQVTTEMRNVGYDAQIECKPAGLAVHWRGLGGDDAERVRTAAERSFKDANPPASLEMMPFEAGVELRSTTRTKGRVVSELLSQEPADTVVAYLGDDLTDEDAFFELQGRGLGILVRPQPRESYAGVHLVPPQELISFLDRWADAVRED